MPQGPSGTKVTAAFWNRLISSIPSSYTIFKDGTTYYAESNVKGGTDFSQDDEDNGVLLQSCIDAGAKTIFYKEGTYPFPADATPPNVELTTSNVSIIGAGMGKTVWTPQNYVLGNYRITANRPIIGSPISNVLIDGITFDYTSYQDKQAIGFRQATNTTIKNCEFIYSTAVNVKVTSFWFERNYMHNLGSTINGVMVRGGEDIHINFNSFKNGGDDLIVAVPNGPDDGYASQEYPLNIEIIGNIGDTSTNGNGAIVYGGKRVVIADNVFSNMNSGGVSATVVTSANDDIGHFMVILKGNVIDSASNTAGVQLWASSGDYETSKQFLVANNIVINSFGGIYVFSCHDGLITGNVCLNNTNHGVKLQGDKNDGTIGHLKNIRVLMNTLTGNGGYGVDVYSASGVTGVSQVDIVDNDLRNNTGGSYQLEGGGSVSNLVLKRNKGEAVTEGLYQEYANFQNPAGTFDAGDCVVVKETTGGTKRLYITADGSTWNYIVIDG